MAFMIPQNSISLKFRRMHRKKVKLCEIKDDTIKCVFVNFTCQTLKFSPETHLNLPESAEWNKGFNF